MLSGKAGVLWKVSKGVWNVYSSRSSWINNDGSDDNDDDDDDDEGNGDDNDNDDMLASRINSLSFTLSLHRNRCKRCYSRKDPEVGIPQEESLTNQVANSSAGMPIVKVTIPSKHSTAKSCIIEIPEPIPLNLPLTPIPMRQSSSSTSFLNAELKPCDQSSLAESDNEMPRSAVQENHSGSTESLSSLQFFFEPALPLITQNSHQKNSKSLEAGATEDLTSNNQCKTTAIKKKRGKASLFFPDSSP